MTVEEIAKKRRTQQMHRINKEPNKGSSSGACGVSWSERRKKWRAYVTHNRKTLWIGEFRDKDMAIQAVNECREAIVNKEE